MSLSLNFVKPEELHNYWKTIRPGLETVKHRINADWMPEDVYMAIKLGTSFLHVGFDDGRYVGFFVLTPEKFIYSGKANLHIWIVYNEGRPTILEDGFPAIEQMAQRGKSETISFSSPRRGWERRAKAFGFEVKDITLVKRMD